MLRAPRLFFWLVVALGAAAWLWFGFGLAPDWIRDAYQGEGPALLRRAIAARAPRPLSDYLELWRRSVWALGALWLALGLAAWMATRSDFQRWIDRTLGAAPKLALRQDLGRRLPRVQALILFLLFAQAAAIASWIEIWPFSPYRMFSLTRPAPGPALTKYRLAGVPSHGSASEFSLTPQMIQPLFNAAFQATAARARRSADSQVATRDLAAALLALYDEGRREGRHDGPALRSLRLYEYVWFELDPDARDADRPHRRTLLATARRPD